MTIIDDAPRVMSPDDADAAVAFRDLGLPDAIVHRLESQGKHTAFPIQAAVIPDALAGRDVAGRAPTGSGKTLGFGLPLVAGLTNARPKRPVALVLAPTRELAEQIMAELTPFAKAAGHDATSIYGGVGYGGQRKALDQGIELVVACPGRLEDLIQMRAIDLRDVATVVIDEADQMADMGFLPAVRRIVEQTSNNRQVLLFSATLDGPVAKLVADFQHDPVRHEVGPKGPDVHAAQHALLAGRSRRSRLRPLPTSSSASARRSSSPAPATVPTASPSSSAQLGVTAQPIHGGRSQGQRDRALAPFKKGQAQRLIATDVAARGIHVNGVNAVIHYDPPAEDSTYHTVRAAPPAPAPPASWCRCSIRARRRTPEAAAWHRHQRAGHQGRRLDDLVIHRRAGEDAHGSHRGRRRRAPRRPVSPATATQQNSRSRRSRTPPRTSTRPAARCRPVTPATPRAR